MSSAAACSDSTSSSRNVRIATAISSAARGPVARLQRRQELVQLGLRALAAAGGTGAQRHEPGALAVVEQPLDDLRGAAVAGGGGDREVDRAVGPQEPLERVGIVEVDVRLGERAQPLELGAVERGRRSGRGGRLEQQAEVVDLDDVAHSQRRDDVAAAWLRTDEPLRPQ
jgi:hypothetical protein